MHPDETATTRPAPPRVLGLLALVVGVVGLSAIGARALRGRPPVALAEGPASPPTGAPKALAGRGRLLYQVQCARCHGPDGHGDGPDSADLRPPPRDFASGTWRAGAGPGAIRKAIVEGIAGTSMYPMGGSFSPRELDALVEHVRSLASKSSGLEASLESAGFQPASPGKKAPAFEVVDLEGGARSLEFGRSGKLTLLVFWGTSCAPCLEEMPDLDRLAAEFAGRGLQVVPVCVDEDDRARVARSLRGRFDRSPSFVSLDGMARLRYDIQTLPVACLIDRRGDLVGIARGGVDWSGEKARRLIVGLLDGPR